MTDIMKKCSEEEGKLLTAAAQDAQDDGIMILRLNEGNFIRVGKRDFPDDESKDPVYDFERYFEAVKRLEKNGYIRLESKDLYKLTTEGHKKARKLAGK
jgi:hypothetical protein